MFRRLRLRERAIQYLIKLSSSTPLDHRLVALEGDVAKVQRDVSSRTREEADLSRLVTKLSALQTRVDVISTNVAALRSEVMDASSARQRARQEQLDDAVSAAVRGTRETIDARVENVLSLLNAAQTASLAQIGQLLIGQHALEARLSALEGLASAQAGAHQSSLLSDVMGVMDGKVNNLIDILNAAQASLIERLGALSLAQHATDARLAVLEDRGTPSSDIHSTVQSADTIGYVEDKISNLLGVINSAQTTLLERIGALSVAQYATDARLATIEATQAGLPTLLNDVQGALLAPVGNLGVTVHALQARHELLEKAQQQVPEALNRVQGDLLRMLGALSIDVGNLKQQLQLVGETGLTRSEHELATGSMMQVIETAQQAGLDLQACQISTVTAAIGEARQAFQHDMLRFQNDLTALRAEIAALRNRAQV